METKFCGVTDARNHEETDVIRSCSLPQSCRYFFHKCFLCYGRRVWKEIPHERRRNFNILSHVHIMHQEWFSTTSGFENVLRIFNMLQVWWDSIWVTILALLENQEKAKSFRSHMKSFQSAPEQLQNCWNS